ncbi:MAG: hypothetical protein Pars92KO_04780 [Parasphingorhabdus sp.]
MKILAEIYSRDKATYYNFQTNVQKSLVKKNTGIFVAALMISAVSGRFSNDVLGPLISLFSILIGFGFTAQFFLVDKRFEISKRDGVIEDKQLEDKLNTLSKELFSNIQYYNVVLTSTVIIIVINLLTYDPKIFDLIFSDKILMEKYDLVAGYLGAFFIALLGIEAISSFFRIVFRTEYLFRKLQEKK